MNRNLFKRGMIFTLVMIMVVVQTLTMANPAKAIVADVVVLPRNYNFNWSSSGANIQGQPPNNVIWSANPDYWQVLYWRTTDTGGGVTDWNPNIQVAGNYDIYVAIPNYSHYAPITHLAKYYFNGELLATVDQNVNMGGWTYLGRKWMPVGTNDTIAMPSYTGENSPQFHLIAGDGMKFVFVNDPPTAYSQSVSTNEDTAKAITLTGYDPNATPLGYTITSNPAHGSLSGALPYATYTPWGNYNGPDSFTFVVNDDYTNSGPATVWITVNPVNDLPVVALDNQTVPENSLVNTVVGNITATDVDGDGITLAVDCNGLPDNANFNIANVGGINRLRTSAIFNFEAKSSYNICIRATDSQGGSTYKSVTIQVSNVNEAPYGTALSKTSIAENSALNSVVGNISASDPDNGDSLTFSLSCTGADNSSFSINNTNKTLLTSVPLNFETKNAYQICIQARDALGLTYDKTFTISVTDVNEPPTSINVSNLTLPENQPANTVVGTVTGSDPDAGDGITFSLACASGGADNASFSLTGGVLRTAGAFNFEAKSTYSICIRATDGSGLTKDQNFTFTVADVNEAPTDISITKSNVPEDAPPGTEVAVITVSDPDAGNSPTVSLDCAGADNGSFTLSGGSLKTATPLDFETQSTYHICIRATDGSGLTYDENITISVTDVNEGPSNIDISVSNVSENMPIGTEVGIFTSNDPDAGDYVSFTLDCTGADNAAFTIVDDHVVSRLLTAQTFNFETKASYSICIRATDSSGETYDKPFTITVDDQNESPTGIDLSLTVMEENKPAGSTVGEFSTTDPDTGDSFTYTLVNGTGDTDNDKFSVDGNKLQISAPFDFEAKNSYTIRVQVTDGGGKTFTRQFTIEVSDINEAPSGLTLSNASVADLRSVETVVGTFTTTDQDAGDTHTYALVNGAEGCDGTGNAAFSISGNTLRTAQVLDYVKQSSYAICVSTTDADGLALQRSFTITVTPSEDLRLTPVCDGRWKVTNTTPYTIQYNWKAANSTETGNGLVNPGGVAFFNSTPGAKVVELYTGTTRQDKKSSSPNSCLLVSDTDLIVETWIGQGGGNGVNGLWLVDIPENVVAEGSWSYIQVFDTYTGPGSARERLGDTVEINIQQDGIYVTRPELPVTICVTYSDTALANLGLTPQDLVIGTAPAGVTEWEFIETTVDEEAHRVCGSAQHFSLFSLFTNRNIVDTLKNKAFLPFLARP